MYFKKSKFIRKKKLTATKSSFLFKAVTDYTHFLLVHLHLLQYKHYSH